MGLSKVTLVLHHHVARHSIVAVRKEDSDGNKASSSVGIQLQRCVGVYVHVCVCGCMYMCGCACTCVCVGMYTCVCMYMCVWGCMYMCVWGGACTCVCGCMGGSPLHSNLCSPARAQWQLGSLSHLINAQATGYIPLSDFPTEAPDPSVRVIEVC